MRLYFSLLLALVLLPLPLIAQEEDGEDPRPDPVQLMRATDAAMGKFETLAATIQTSGIGAMSTRSPQTKATLHIRRASERNPAGWMFRVEGEVKKGEETFSLLTAFDGRDVRSIREHEQVVVESTWENSAEPMADGAGWVVLWLVRWRELVSRPFAADTPAWLTRYEGVVEVDGELCDVVYVDYSEVRDPNLYDAWWYIARSDSLPRRIEMHMVDRAGDGFFVTRISSLTPEAPVETAMLTLATPEGYQVRGAEVPEQPRTARARRPVGVPTGDLAPDWTLSDPSGKQHTLSEYRGKVVIMDFWATWCGPCLRAMPGLQALHEKYKDRGVVIFGINCWESGDPEALMTKEGFEYTLLLEGDPVAAMYSVSGIPTFYIVSPEGRIAHHAVGFDPKLEEKLEEIIDALLPDGP
jgi:thiol-disulfide isomerase/thioredoxin